MAGVREISLRVLIRPALLVGVALTALLGVLVLPGSGPATAPERVWAQSNPPTATPTVTPTPTATATPEPTATCGTSPLHGRTQKIVDGIVAKVPNVTACANVTSSHLAAIGSLSFRNRSLASLQAGDFAGLTGLDSLWLSENNLTMLPADLFKEPTSLTALYLSDNHLTALDKDLFKELTSLTTLDLYDNRLTTLPTTLFTGLSNLTTLSLQNNQLTTLTATQFSGLSNLQSLLLQNNQLTTLAATQFSGLSNLQILSLQDNRLTSLPVTLFAGLTSLQTLSLHDNLLTTLPTNVFAGLSKLRELILAGTELETLDTNQFAGLTSLSRLFLNQNKFQTLPSGLFTGLSNLTNINLQNNRLTALDKDLFKGLTNLTSLYLHGNRLTTLPASLFAGPTGLQSLSLHSNQLTTLDKDLFDGLSSLQLLALQKNQLACLPSDLFAGLTSLTTLSLWNNRLACLPNNAFAGLTSLTTLYLDGNQLGNVAPSYFDYAAGSKLSALTTLWLGANRDATTAELNQYKAVGMTALTTLKMTNDTTLPTPPVCMAGCPVATATPRVARLTTDAAASAPVYCDPPDPTATPGPPPAPVLPRIIGDSGYATAYELAGDRLLLRIHNHDHPAGAKQVEIGVGWLSIDGTQQVAVGFVRDATAGQTYAVVRREADGQIVRWWVAPDSPLAAQIPWATVQRDYTFHAAVLAAIPLGQRAFNYAPGAYPWLRWQPTPTPRPAPVLPRLIGDSGHATAYELAGDRLLLRIHHHDRPGAAQAVEIGVGWLAADGTKLVAVGFVRDATTGHTYAVLRQQADGQIVRRWVPPDSLLATRIPWAQVQRHYTFPAAVLAAIPLYERPLAYDPGWQPWLHSPPPTPTVTPTPTPDPSGCILPDPPATPTIPALPRIIGDSGAATAYELAGDRVLLRIHHHDQPAAAEAVEIGVGWLAANGTEQVLVGFVRDAAAGQTYAVVRRETDGQIVRRWVPPDSLLVALIPWAQVARDYTFPAGVLAAIPLDAQYPSPNQLVRIFGAADQRLFTYDSGQQQWLHVPDLATFQALGFYWCDVTVADAAFMQRISPWASYPASSTPARPDYPSCRPSQGRSPGTHRWVQ